MKCEETRRHYVPTHLQIETINGVCSARCPMCTIDSWTRKVQIMPSADFRKILVKFLPYRDHLQFLTLHGFSEPLLDRNLPEKVSIAKELGFRGVGFASNCTHLDEKMAHGLLEARLDTIICSIDGIHKETHEKIRPRTNFDKVVANVKNFINLRNSGNFPTRVILRFIYQQLNHQEWPGYCEFWGALLDRVRGDDVTKLDIHNFADKIENYAHQDTNLGLPLDGLVCSDVFERMYIYSNGCVGLCCADDNGFFNLGNVLQDDPIEIYNNAIFTQYRQTMLEGHILQLKHCQGCTIPRSRLLKNNAA